MKVVVTLGGNALLRRGQPMTACNQRENVRVAVMALRNVALRHRLILGHGNGPQVGLIALQNDAYAHQVPAYPFDILGAESQAMVGYMFAQEMRNALGEGTVVSLVTQSVVDPEDPAFSNPTKFIGPVYTEEQALALEKEKGWVMKADGQYRRRVVPSPLPRRIVEIEAIRRLVDAGVTVIAGGGGGVPVVEKDGKLQGLEAVIDKDYCSSLMARELNADRLIIATDVKGVFTGWGTPEQKLIRSASPETLLEMGFAAGSMGPKVLAACEFARATGRRAVIGALEEIEGMVEGMAGTQIQSDLELAYY